jgi:hypothetical protein
MQTDIENSARPIKTAMLWELSIPDNCFNEAVERCETKGRTDFAIYEGTRVHGYQMTLCVITSIFNEAIKLVYFDGKLLHIFMKDRLPQNHTVQLKRLFDARSLLPDHILHDILANSQALFTTREQIQTKWWTDTVETTYVGLRSYEGATDYSDIKDLLIENDILGREGNVALVYEVEELREVVFENTDYDNVRTKFIGGTETLVDTLMFARQLQTDPIKRKAVVAIAERTFASRSKTSKKPKSTKQKVDEARRECKELAPEFETLKKMKQAAKAK